MRSIISFEQAQQADLLGSFVFEYVPQEFFFHVGGHRLECRSAAANLFQFRAEFVDAFFLAGFVGEFNECHVVAP
jgi:hypothetical protein